KIKGQIYVIIDEYDHFANEILSFQTELFSSIVSKTGFVRKFYEVLKKGTEFIVKRIFMTGVSPITLDSLTSGFNISDDLTRNDSFNEMMGFTKKEVMDLIKNIVPKTLKKTELKELLETLQKNYNGYLFASDGKERLFNSDMILYYMKSYMNSGKGPESLIDKNIATDYGKLGKMFDLKNKSANMQVLEDVLKGERITARITEGFSLEKDFSKDDFKSLLFYLGMLTIDKKVLDRSTLKVPNYAIKGLYFEYFNKKLNETIDYEIDVSDIEDSITEIALEGKNENLIKVVEKTLNKLSNRDYIKFDEKYVKLIFLAYCFLSKIYLVKSEYEVESGYIDIALLKQANMEPTYFAIFQLKYITKAEYE
ncbi:AAA family ATPase, partial [Clostridium magnum]